MIKYEGNYALRKRYPVRNLGEGVLQLLLTGCGAGDLKLLPISKDIHDTIFVYNFVALWGSFTYEFIFEEKNSFGKNAFHISVTRVEELWDKQSYMG